MNNEEINGISVSESNISMNLCVSIFKGTKGDRCSQSLITPVVGMLSTFLRFWLPLKWSYFFFFQNKVRTYAFQFFSFDQFLAVSTANLISFVSCTMQWGIVYLEPIEM